MYDDCPKADRDGDGTSDGSHRTDGGGGDGDYDRDGDGDRGDDGEHRGRNAERLDRENPLAGFRDRFAIPEGECYMDGNSLGLLSADAEAAVKAVVDEWRELAVQGWDAAEPPWFTYGERLGDRVAPLVGARESEVVVANSTTINIHSLIGTFYNGDGKILVGELDFPTDHYAIRAQLRRAGRDPDDCLEVVESHDGRTIDEDDVVRAMDEASEGSEGNEGDGGDGTGVEILFFPSVLYRSGQLFDIEYLTEAAHERGILAGFDLAHSIGVVPHDLSTCGVDFAAWCSYKYLNGGPGALAGLYVNERHFGRVPSLPGWWGHEKETQFDMDHRFTPAANAGAYQIGTPPILAAAALDGALTPIEEAGIEAIRGTSIGLSEYLIDLVDDRLADQGCAVGTPRDPARRGGHVAIEHEEADRISRALRERGVIVDYRPPNVVRVCPSPLYTRYADVERIVAKFEAVLETGAYERFEPATDGVT